MHTYIHKPPHTCTYAYIIMPVNLYRAFVQCYPKGRTSGLSFLSSHRGDQQQ